MRALEQDSGALRVVAEAVRLTAAQDHPAAVIEAWAPLPITEEAVDSASANPDGEIRVGAVLGDVFVGVGAVVPRLRELRTCYVFPENARSGVGRMIVAELEAIARAQSAPFPRR